MALSHTYEDNRSGFFTSLIDGLSRGFGYVAEANARAREFERLNAMSDVGLAAKGLNREDIARYVFRDMSWT